MPPRHSVQRNSSIAGLFEEHTLLLLFIHTECRTGLTSVRILYNCGQFADDVGINSVSWSNSSSLIAWFMTTEPSSPEVDLCQVPLGIIKAPVERFK